MMRRWPKDASAGSIWPTDASLANIGSASAGPPARPRRDRSAMPADDPATAAAQRRFYGRRRGRPLRPGQSHLRETRLPQLAVTLPETGVLDPASLFATRPGSVWLEIGFGAGEHLAAQAEAHPDTGFI